ncbi:phosphoheptose isomerase [Kaistia sp. 32K]|uniref:D-sedoheptulose-7-phosphate isomerase n=1 Tax=Kaistia sp. 32K TaxID=2795690 RepID=UPI0019391646|nr:SIS domain-containing protein [Kaistia sp. 32K]BCP52340.1 phosphoheptose isomerase [Kaistia sp. 32K]
MILQTRIGDATRAFEGLTRMEPDIERAAQSIVSTLRRGGRVLVCGNGGSAAEGQHLVTELVGRYRSNRQPLPAIYLGGDVGQMTCIANDFTWDDVFARPLRALAQPGDLLLCLSTSGTSSNIIAALSAAREMAIESIALLGRSGGDAAALADHPLIVASADTGRIQEVHLFLIHWFCEYIEVAFPAKPAASSIQLSA